ncbi:MAG TPA: putative Ig domain-containing protein, partial [Leptospiraceae bacterium]|nr:putative Ig domain-containing protein [Leptospiraceae bacterium]
MNSDKVLFTANRFCILNTVFIIYSFLFLFTGCLKVKRSPFDVSSPSGSILTNAIIAAFAKIVPPSAPVQIPAPGITYTGSPYSFVRFDNIQVTPTVTGTVTSCTVSPSLPAGLSLNSSTCVISGSPAAAQSAVSYSIKAANSSNSTTVSISIAVTTAIIYAGLAGGLSISSNGGTSYTNYTTANG